MNWRKWLSMGMAAAMAIGLSNLDMVQAAEGEDAQDVQSATAYLYFTDGNWSQEINYHKPGGDGQTKTIAQEEQITGDGTYHLALDFTGTNNKKTNKCTKVKICISNGDAVFGSNSVIALQKVVINGVDRELPKGGFTASQYNWFHAGTKDTIFYLYDGDAGDKSQIENSRTEWETKDLNLFPDLALVDIETIEVDFSFSVNGTSAPSGSPSPSASTAPSGSPSPSASTNPNKTPGPSASPAPSGLPSPSASTNPNKTPGPSASPAPSGSPSPSASPDPNKTPGPSASTNPNKTPGPNESSNPNTSQNPNQSGAQTSNSTYTGAERVIVQNTSVVISAGGSSTVTFALLRSATSDTKVSVSSGDTGIASPVLQEDGKVHITVPGTAAPGSSTTVTLQFGSSSAPIKVTVRNAASKVKAAKKSYNVKRNKKTKVVFQITAQNKSKATTDEPLVKLSGKKATISSVKLSGSKLTVTVKGVKKGSATLKTTVGGKTANAKLKIK